MQSDKGQLNNWLTRLLSIAACILFILIVRQYITIQKAQNDVNPSGTLTTVDTKRTNPLTVNQQEAEYKKTIQLLQTQLNNLQNVTTQDPGASRAGAIPPPDGSGFGGYNGDDGIINRTYKPLLKKLNLSSEETEKFMQFLVERRQSWIEIEDEILTVSLSDEDWEATIKELESIAWEYDDKARKLLGYDNYAKYNEYNNSIGIFLTDPVEEFVNVLGSNEEINNYQSDQLYASMADEFEEFVASSLPEVKGPPGFRIGLQDENVVNEIVDGLDNLQQRYISRAESILSESQMNAFVNVIDSMIAQRKVSYMLNNEGSFRE